MTFAIIFMVTCTIAVIIIGYYALKNRNKS